MASVARHAAAALLATIAGTSLAQAQTALRLHEPIAVPQRPMLCADRDSVSIIIPVLARVADARAARDTEKSQRFTEIANRLQGEVCRKTAADDVVVLRCKLGQVDAGGTPLALVKISALIQTEAAKGEQTFYGWTDAKVDDATSAGGQESHTRWCGSERATRQIQIVPREEPTMPVTLVTPPQVTPQVQDSPAAGEPFTATPDIVYRVQQRLFDFGLKIANVDGNLNHETVQGLTQFQKMVSLPADGSLTRSTVEKLMTTPAPGPWVAIAFDGYGNFAAETGRIRRETEMTAFDRMQRRSGRDIQVASASTCIGFAVTGYSQRGRRSRNTFTQAFASAGDTMEIAARNAVEFCERDKGGGQCQMRYALCADGSGPQASRNDPPPQRNDPPPQRFDPGGVPANSPRPQRFDPTVTPNNSRFDPSAMPANSPPPGFQQPTQRFDPSSPSLNSRAPQGRPPAPSRSAPQPTTRFDPSSLPDNAPPQRQ
jgi:hypothetical protein